MLTVIRDFLYCYGSKSQMDCKQFLNLDSNSMNFGRLNVCSSTAAIEMSTMSIEAAHKKKRKIVANWRGAKKRIVNYSLGVLPI